MTDPRFRSALLVGTKAAEHIKLGANIHRGRYANIHAVDEFYRSRHPQYQASPKRAEAARDLGKKLGVEVKHLYLTSGESDLVVFVDTPSGDNVAKFVLALGSLGNVRTRTARVWSADEYTKLVSELP